MSTYETHEDTNAHGDPKSIVPDELADLPLAGLKTGYLVAMPGGGVKLARCPFCEIALPETPPSRHIPECDAVQGGEPA